MSKAGEILEAIYKVYNVEEEVETYGQEKPEYRPDFTSDGLRNQFIGTVMTSGNDNNPYKILRDCIDKMPDEWVAEFLKVINGDVVEKVSESVNEEEITDSWTKEKIKIILGFLINVPEFEEKYGMTVNEVDPGYVLTTRAGKKFTIRIENGERNI